jgi:hypothetical protein
MTEPVTAIEGHPRHPDLLCAASERDKKIAFFDFRGEEVFDISVSISIPTLQLEPLRE